MAVTNTYVDYATGNDYKGASFTDGVYTSATKTLVKASAFTATRANHWLYLESNDGGSIVAGYYRVATRVDADTVVLATDAGGGVDDDAVKCTRHDGTTSLPWRSVQGALDLITRDATNGDQINVKAGTAQVNVTTLTLTTYGTPTLGAPLIIRGYTAAANDGGIGEIDCGGATMCENVAYIHLIDLECHTFGNNNGLSFTSGGNHFIANCEFHKGASTPDTKILVNLATVGCIAVGLYVHDPGQAGTGIFINDGTLTDSYIANCTTGITGASIAIGNIVSVPENGTGISNPVSPSQYMHNVVYAAGGTGTGIALGAEAHNKYDVCLNNLIVGFSGTGAKGISSTNDVAMIGHNAFYNNTANYVIDGVAYLDLTANDVALTADPFTDAANGDFSLTAAAKTALAGKGFPLAYLGAHANTVPNLNIGPIQLAASAGGGGRRTMLRIHGG